MPCSEKGVKLKWLESDVSRGNTRYKSSKWTEVVFSKKLTVSNICQGLCCVCD